MTAKFIVTKYQKQIVDSSTDDGYRKYGIYNSIYN